MRLGIAVVFSYQGGTAAVQDIYHAGKYLDSVSDRLIIFTDVQKDEDLQIMSQNVNRGHAGVDALKVISNYKTREVLIYTRNPLQMVIQIQELLREETWISVFFYYSGHSDSGEIRFPGGSRMSFTDLTQIFIQETSPTTEIFCVLDCCYGGGLGLPYRLDDRGVHQLLDDRNLIQHQMICLTSSSPDQSSAGDGYGSFFTRELFKQLQKSNRNLKILLEIINSSCQKTHYQEVHAYASSCRLTAIWPWIYGSKLSVQQGPALIVKFVPHENEHRRDSEPSCSEPVPDFEPDFMVEI